MNCTILLKRQDAILSPFLVSVAYSPLRYWISNQKMTVSQQAQICVICMTLGTLLLNQICLFDAQQAKCWDVKVCCRESVYSWGSQWGDGGITFKFASPKVRDLRHLWDKEAGWSELWGKMTGGKEKSGVIYILPRHIRYMLLHGTCLENGWHDLRVELLVLLRQNVIR